MKRVFASICLWLFISTLCVQSIAKAHSLDLSWVQTHIHVVNTKQHINHQQATQHVIHDDTESKSQSEVFVSCYDFISQSDTQSTLPVQFFYVVVPLLAINPPIGFLEQASLNNNGPPSQKALQPPYFSLAPPQFS